MANVRRKRLCQRGESLRICARDALRGALRQLAADELHDGYAEYLRERLEQRDVRGRDARLTKLNILV